MTDLQNTSGGETPTSSGSAVATAPPTAPVMAAPVVAVPVAPPVQPPQPVAAAPVPLAPPPVVSAEPVTPPVPPVPAPVVSTPVQAVAPPVSIAPQPTAAAMAPAVPVAAAPVASTAVQPVAQPAPVAPQPVVAAPAPAAPVAAAPPPQTQPVSQTAPVVSKPASISQPSPVAAKSTDAPRPAAKAKAPAVVLPSYKDRLKTQTFMQWAHQRLHEAPGYVLSVLLHAVVFFLLSMMVMPAKDREDLFNTIMAKTEEPAEVNEKLDDTQIVPEKLDKLEASVNQMQINSEVVADKPNPVEMDVSDAAPTIEAPDVTDGAGPKIPHGELAGRSQKARGAMLASQGGTAASEQAVNSGLKWLARHQKPDGSWSFKHGPDDPGQMDNPTGATGLALLSFLGGGHTHKSGDYQKQVGAALAYLGTQMKFSGAGGDLRMPGDGHGMYTQGICAIALCEAYALSKDKNLRKPTELAINFIVNAQDSTGGGWRYQPGQKGDTSVVGWQIMALKSAKIAKLQVPNKTIGKATFFLNNVQTNNGANYGYETPGAGRATSAVGLLCRMYLGWTPKNAGLVKGVEFLSATGPQPGDIYFDYYATQVLHHWGGEPWTKWNNVMREYLVTTQVKEGNAAGSWKPVEGAAIGDAQGGRLYRTCMSIMTLEVYYRHLPIYQRETIKVDF